MAKPPATDAEKKSRKKNSVLVWVLMAMLIVGLGGFGVTNFGGGVTAIATGRRPRDRRERLCPRASAGNAGLQCPDRPAA